jgi:hypothetical protein
MSRPLRIVITTNMSFSIVCMSIRKMYFNARPPYMWRRWACKKSGDIYIKQVLCRLIWSDSWRAWVWQSLSHHATLVTAPKVCQIQNYFWNSTVWGSLDHTFQIWRLGPEKRVHNFSFELEVIHVYNYHNYQHFDKHIFHMCWGEGGGYWPMYTS